MAAKGTTFNNDILKLIFNAVAIANLADNAASSPLTQLSVALHTSNPGVGGNQSTSETTYTGYARLMTDRNSATWAVSGSSVSPVNPLVFGAWTAGSATITHFSIGIASSGATKILYTGVVSPSIPLSAGVVPTLGTGTTITES